MGESTKTHMTNQDPKNNFNKFTRVKEDFVCEHCGVEVAGDGYTNHCPKCLWSKHVDINPGDREADCGGMMEPVAVSKRGEEYVILHRCLKCGHEKNNKVVKSDDYEAVLGVVKKMVG
jgi:hypothetical protein